MVHGQNVSDPQGVRGKTGRGGQYGQARKTETVILDQMYLKTNCDNF